MDNKKKISKPSKSNSKTITNLQNTAFFDLINSSTDIIFLKDTSLRYALVNKPYSMLINREPNDIVGKTDYGLWPRDVADKFSEIDRKLNTFDEKIVDHIIINGVVYEISSPPVMITSKTERHWRVY
ncbi:MAG: PAS domain-containing protein [Proteobacteria bacterium]|nr:PAS domain-containing protein [Pseudomonadota bacterium]